MFSYLLTKTDKSCYDILTLFGSQVNRTLLKDNLLQRFDLTNYQLNRYYTQLNNDLVTISETEPIYLDEPTKGVWVAYGVDSFAIQKVALLYLQRSPLFSTLEFQFFYTNQVSAAEYASDHFISQSGFHRAMKQLDQVLEAVNFFENTGLPIGAEFSIRLHLFQLYYTMYNGLVDPFPQLSEVTNRVIQILANQLPEHQLQPTQESKLEIFIKVWLLRCQKHVKLEPNQLAQAKSDTKYAATFAAIQRLLKTTDVEINYLYNFVLSQGIITSESDDKLKQVFPLADQLTTSFLTAIQQTHLIARKTHIVTDKLDQAIFNIHLQLTTFYIEPTTFINPQQVQFFKGLYPVFDLTIREVIDTLQTHYLMHLTDNMKVNLYFSYMFALINNVPIRLLKDSIHICVDFSQGCLYTDYVKNSLASFNNAHLIIDDFVKSGTDIYISDFRAPALLINQVIWRDPPTPLDWSALSDLILTIKQRKIETILKK